MTLFSVDASGYGSVEKDLGQLRGLGFDVSLHEADDPGGVARPAELPLDLEITAMDHPGIVKKVVGILHRHDVNIHSLETQIMSAPLSGAPLFGLAIGAGVPASASVARIKEELNALAADLNMALNFL
jgi:glycine cleavage system regulatory protein